MREAIKQAIKDTAKRFNVGITTYRHLEELEQHRMVLESVGTVLGFGERHAAKLLKLLPESKSQLRQDLFVLAELDLKKAGYFVEFGAASGADLSNTHLLEKHFGWQGIVAEPAKYWHTALKKNRSCHVETDCVWKSSNETLTFNEVDAGREFSTIDSLSASDAHAHLREKGMNYPVKTISLVDLLEKYGAPKVVDFLSIDTEGSEFDILNSFEFARYQFRVITCEHNFTEQREKIYSLLTGNGYERKFEQYSQFDDWYVLAKRTSS